MDKPTIAILGRPNVGKSTLFNRLVGKVHSIVSAEAGVTRDRVYGEFDWRGSIFNIIDTGGYIPNTEDIIENQVRLQAEIAREEADILLLVVDGRNGITAIDQHLANLIQKTPKPHLLTVNKIDSMNLVDKSMEFYELGLGQPIPISAQNNRSIGSLLEGILHLLPKESLAESSSKDYINLAIVGMPNVGKSSLMNGLIKQEKAIVTPIAGTTRDSVDSFIRYHKRDIRLIDTAGLRRKSKITGNIEFYSSIRTHRVIDECDITTVLIDASKGFTNQDKDIVRLVIDHGKGLILVVNKWDKIKKDGHTMKEFEQDIIYQYPGLEYYPILFISILENLRLRQVLKTALTVYDERERKLKTSEVNEFVKKAMAYYLPPAIKGKNLTIKYGTQVHHSPPIFAFFSNHPQLIPIQYKRYLENSLRDYFGYSGVPIKISFRKNK